MIKTVTSVVCDRCGSAAGHHEEVHSGREANALAAARALGWHRFHHGAALLDYCPACWLCLCPAAAAVGPMPHVAPDNQVL